MKKYIIIAQCGLFLFLGSLNAGAQNNPAPVATPEAKAANVDNTLKSTSKNSTVSDIKEPAKPVGLPLQKTEASKQDMPSDAVKPTITEPKIMDVRPNTLVRIEPKEAEAPKNPTTSGLKTGDPLKLPVKPAPPKE